MRKVGNFASGRIKVNAPADADPLRHDYLSLENAEPNLGVPGQPDALLLSHSDGTRRFAHFGDNFTISDTEITLAANLVQTITETSSLVSNSNLQSITNTGNETTNNIVLNGSDLVFDTGTWNTTLQAETATVPRTITLPDETGTVVTSGATTQIFGADNVTDLSYDYFVNSEFGPVKIDPNDALAGLIMVDEAIDATQNVNYNILMVQTESLELAGGSTVAARAAMVDNGGVTFNPNTNTFRSSGAVVASTTLAAGNATSGFGAITTAAPNADLKILADGTGKLYILKHVYYGKSIMQIDVGDNGLVYNANNDAGTVIAYNTAANTAVTDLVNGTEYQIVSVGTTTTWSSVGGPTTPSIGSVFTATGAGTGDGIAVGTASQKRAFFGWDRSEDKFKWIPDATVVGDGSQDTTVTGPVGDAEFKNLTLTGDLVVQGNTVTIDTTTLTIEDPIIFLGNSNNSVDDNLDRGVAFYYNDPSATINPGPKQGFMGWDDNEKSFVLYDDVSESNGIITKNAFGEGDLLVNGINSRQASTLAFATASLEALTVGGNGAKFVFNTSNQTNIGISTATNSGATNFTIENNQTEKVLLDGTNNNIKLYAANTTVATIGENTSFTGQFQITNENNLSLPSNTPTLTLNNSNTVNDTVVLSFSSNNSLTLVSDAGVFKVIPQDVTSGIPPVSVLEVDGQQVRVTTNTASTSTSTGALVVSGGLGIAEKLYTGSDIYVDSNSTLHTDVITNYDNGLFLLSAAPGTTAMQISGPNETDGTVPTPVIITGGSGTSSSVTGGDVEISGGTSTTNGVVKIEGQIFPQSVGTTGQVLKVANTSTGQLEWATDTTVTYTFTAADTGGTADNPALSINGSDSTVDPVQLVGGTNVTVTRNSDSQITFSSVDLLQNITAEENEDADRYITFVDATTGAQEGKTDTSLTYNSAKNELKLDTLSLKPSKIEIPNGTGSLIFEKFDNHNAVINLSGTSSGTLELRRGNMALVILGTSRNVQLTHQGNVKLETANTGVDVTGTLTANNLTVSSQASIGTLTANNLTVSSQASINDLLVPGGTISIGTANSSLTSTILGNGTLTIDPAPVAGDANGTVIIKGDLQIDGTTTTINSTELTVEDKEIIIASGATTLAQANGASLTIGNISNAPDQIKLIFYDTVYDDNTTSGSLISTKHFYSKSSAYRWSFDQVKRGTAPIEHIVKVAAKNVVSPYLSDGSSNEYLIDGISAPMLTMQPNVTYRFLQDDASNTGHPLLFYYDLGKTRLYQTDVTVVGTPGQPGAYTQIEVTDNTPSLLYYQCSIHSRMGSHIQVVGHNLTGFDTDDLAEGSTNQYFTADRARSSFTQGTGVAINSGVISIGQDVASTAAPIFAGLTLNGNILVNPGVSNQITAPKLNLTGPDETLVFNADLGAAAPSDDIKIVVNRGSATDAYIEWDETNDRWNISDGTNTGTIATSYSTDIDAATPDGQQASYYLNYNNLTNKPQSLLDFNIADGTAGQVLQTDGNGNFSFTTITGANANTVSGSGGYNAVQNYSYTSSGSATFGTETNKWLYVQVFVNGVALASSQYSFDTASGIVTLGAAPQTGAEVEVWAYNTSIFDNVDLISVANTGDLTLANADLYARDVYATGEIHAGLSKTGTAVFNVSSDTATNTFNYVSNDFVSAKLTIHVRDNSLGEEQVQEALILTNGSTPMITTYATIYSGTDPLAEFDVVAVSGSTYLEITRATDNNSVIKVQYTLLES